MPKITNKLIDEYIKSLSKDDLKVLQIAKDELETSFNIQKSIGLKKWIQKNNK